MLRLLWKTFVLLNGSSIMDESLCGTTNTVTLASDRTLMPALNVLLHHLSGQYGSSPDVVLNRCHS